MKIAAVLTYPGHFLMTVLCLRSIRLHYPFIDKIYVLYDDLAPAWQTYARDCESYYNTPLVPYSKLLGIDHCSVGWWRAQLIKLHLDLILPDDEWFTVDGDVIFDESVDVHGRTPYSVSINLDDSVLDLMVDRYLDRMLCRSNARIQVPGYPMVITSCVPFRWLNRRQLKSLREHVQTVNQKESFLDWHCEMFLSQDIVGYVPEGDRMVMHEWELIEAWNQMSAPHKYSLLKLSCGYQTTVCTTEMMPPRYRHSSLKDRDLGRAWFSDQGVTVSDELWHNIQHV